MICLKIKMYSYKFLLQQIMQVFSNLYCIRIWDFMFSYKIIFNRLYSRTGLKKSSYEARNSNIAEKLPILSIVTVQNFILTDYYLLTPQEGQSFEKLPKPDIFKEK